MSSNINEQVLAEVQSSKYGFAIQPPYETTNVSNCAKRLCVMLLRIPFEVNYC